MTPRPTATRSTNSPEGKLAAMRLQRELLRRLREDHAQRKEAAKAAKGRVDLALADLERMAGDSAQQELFPGSLKVDPETGEVLDYRGPGDDGESEETR